MKKIGSSAIYGILCDFEDGRVLIYNKNRKFVQDSYHEVVDYLTSYDILDEDNTPELQCHLVLKGNFIWNQTTYSPIKE